ncbi:AAA-ATPase [Gregarina niphandrodes]|uniref:AAA-ATPase n=1 Tax=Gregarina niphandrodes TaxID=110365 RepID=A0A023BAJ3_GRENI|nr:AAA-ATPase [Gregarina niphandrodes]EZG78357.1 AAA-ATPase [Gregarina niphandrodes]|eukprot:XP_011129337.1 AAA-ATPase [Gregarina niphandrodes]
MLGEIHRRNGSILDRDFPALCGFTREELIKNFYDEIETLGKTNDSSTEEVLDVLSRRYGGYRFHHPGIQLFHPWSVQKRFHESEFGEYSDQIGIPEVLKLLREGNYNLSALLGRFGLECESDVGYGVGAGC